MKKNKMMRIASVLLVAVLLTTSIISGTFAKYVTEGSANDSARVAKFGVTIASSGNLFSQTYAIDATGTEDEDGLSVVSTEKVVAPGTKSNDTTPFKITVTGTPEVDVIVTLAIEDGFSDVYLKAGNYQDRTTQVADDEYALAADYYPIKYTVKAGDGDTVATADSIEALQEALEEYSLYCEAGELQDVEFTLSWAWAFENDDKADTILGDLAAGTYSYATSSYSLTASVKLTVTVTQVD